MCKLFSISFICNMVILLSYLIIALKLQHVLFLFFFIFMLSSVFLKYKDVVHTMPTKCLKADNVFDLVKNIIISLEEIGF